MPWPGQQEYEQFKRDYEQWASVTALDLGGRHRPLTRGDFVDLGMVAAVCLFGVWIMTGAGGQEDEQDEAEEKVARWLERSGRSRYT